jgi:hypothetical protein
MKCSGRRCFLPREAGRLLPEVEEELVVASEAGEIAIMRSDEWNEVDFDPRTRRFSGLKNVPLEPGAMTERLGERCFLPREGGRPSREEEELAVASVAGEIAMRSDKWQRI